MSELAKAKEAVKEASERGKSKRSEYRRKQKAAARRAGMETIWAPQYNKDGTPGPQVALITCPIPEILFGGARGGGKGQALDQPIMTPFGWKTMGDMKVGTAVCNPDGSTCHVIAIHPLGERQLYRVSFHDGTSCEVTDDHIWLAWKSNKGQKQGGVRQFGEQSARLWTTKAMIEDMKIERGVAQNFLIPITKPVCITTTGRVPPRPVPPYLLGVLLGDGSLSNAAVVLACEDPETAARIQSLIEPLGATLSQHARYEGKCQSYRLYNGEITKYLGKWGLLGTNSFTKFIPQPYLLGNVEERWELLRGLMDTDGWADQDGDIYYGTSSAQLRDDVAHLARSLGAVVTIRSKIPTYEYLGEKLQGSQAWSLRIKLRDNSMAFHMERKKALCSRTPQSMSKTIVSIEPSRVAVAQCIQVSHPNGLYLTNDFTVTHNTDAALGAWMVHANKYGPYAKGMFIRRQFKQLEEVQNRCTMLFPKLGANYIKGEALWQFPNGATLKLRHLWDEADADSYQGHQYNFLVLEELTQWPTPGPMDKMRATLRSAHGVECRIICTANPGGTGHSWVKNRYITPNPKGYMPIKDPETGSLRVFIPSRLQDNHALFENDPNYEQRLLASGNPALVRAWLHGDWDALAGGFMDDVFNADKHLIRPFTIPAGFRWRRSFDWGSAAPASLGIWAISDGSPVHEMGGFVFPRGSLIRVEEWYTVAYKNGQIDPNKGLRLTNLALGEGIGNRVNGRNFSGCVADPAIFSEHGRQSIFSEMQVGAREVGHHLLFNRADNNRVAGWQKVRDMLENAAKDNPEKPGLWAFETCIHYARTMPVLQRDDKKPDDIDTDQEDHCLHGETLVETRGGPLMIKDLVGTTGEVLTIGGDWRPYYDCRMTRRNAECIVVSTEDGRSFISTPDHKVLTESGWIEAKDLLENVIVTANGKCYNNPSHQLDGVGSAGHRSQRHNPGIPERSILSLRSVLPEEGSAFARQSVGDQERPHTGWLAYPSQGRGSDQQPTRQFGGAAGSGALGPAYEHAGAQGSGQGAYGKGCAARCLRMARLGSRAGLALAALSRAHRSAKGCDGGLRVRALQKAVSAFQAGCRKVGILLQQMQVSRPAGERGGQRDPDLSDLPEAIYGQQIQQVQDVQPDLRRRAPVGSKVVSVEPAGFHDVFNLEVDETHAFAIEGGLIVHNCADEVRYACMTGGRSVVEGAITGH